MNLNDYLRQKADEIDDKSRHIKDFKVFDFSYIPSEPLMREEFKPVIDASLRYLKTGVANHLYLFGSRGSGKTLMMRYLGKRLSEQFKAEVLYANCRHHNTGFKILAHLLGARPRGCSLDEFWFRFTSEHSGPLILILDEVDLISDKDRNRDILYLLSRSPENYMVVLLSNHPKFLNSLDESIRSSLQPEQIHFRNYDADQIRQILRQRAKAGLKEFSEDVLANIAALTTRLTNSDVRVAIKTLYNAALEPECDIDKVFNRARRDLLSDILADLNDRNLLILKASAEVAEPFVKKVYERYRQLCQQEHQEPFSYVYFYSSLSYLQSIGLVILLSTKVGRTYTNRIQLLFEPTMFDSIWEERLAA